MNSRLRTLALGRIQKGPVMRSRARHRDYLAHMASLAQEKCDFCHFRNTHSQVVEEYPLFWKVKNIFAYDTWDGCRVNEHLMLVPKRHVTSLSELDEIEKSQYVDLVASAEDDGYNIFSRASAASTKSVPHQHTHLIKYEPRQLKVLLYLRYPHTRFFR
jgi:ATP adenylyltransferase